MYIEINGRQTGKTKRLIDDMKMWLERNSKNIAIICAPNQNAAIEIGRSVEKLVTFDINERIFINCNKFQELPFSLVGTEYSPLDERIRFYWEEFDLCRHDSVVIVENGYYSTTPKFLRKPSDVFEWWSGQRRDNLLALQYVAEKRKLRPYKHWVMSYPKEDRDRLLYGKAIADSDISIGRVTKELDKWA